MYVTPARWIPKQPHAVKSFSAGSKAICPCTACGPNWHLHGYNRFNLLALDFSQGECFWASNVNQTMPTRLEKGIFGLSNAGLDTPWPKVSQLKDDLKTAINGAQDAEHLAMTLFEALSDPTQYPDEVLPHTGVTQEWERMLSPAFIRSPDGSYGTRCSTVIVTERVHKRLVTHVLERTFSPQSSMALPARDLEELASAAHC